MMRQTETKTSCEAAEQYADAMWQAGRPDARREPLAVMLRFWQAQGRLRRAGFLIEGENDKAAVCRMVRRARWWLPWARDRVAFIVPDGAGGVDVVMGWASAGGVVGCGCDV